MDGQPFFVVNQAVDPGRIQVIDRKSCRNCKRALLLKRRAPPIPGALAVALVFDREGYSPAFLLRMKTQHIACLTYHQCPGADWAPDEFAPTAVRLAGGEPGTLPTPICCRTPTPGP